MSPDSSSRACLGFLLDGPLQSWGTASRFQRRGTNHHPSKSGVGGLIAAAGGLPKGSAQEREALAAFAGLTMTTVLLPRNRRRRADEYEPLPVRRLIDYHTIGGGYDKQSDRLMKPRKASGGPREDATVSRREYLMDARFAVLLEGSRKTLETIAASLQDPVWGIWLGRKSCLPAIPLEPVVAETCEEAFRQLLAQAGLPDQPLHAWEREEETVSVAGADASFDDQPVSFGSGRSSGAEGRIFLPRRVILRRPNSEA